MNRRAVFGPARRPRSWSSPPLDRISSTATEPLAASQ